MSSFQGHLEAAKRKQMQSRRHINETRTVINREASVASTATIRNQTPAEFDGRDIIYGMSMFDDDMELDSSGQYSPKEPETLEGVGTLIVATDFGTTFSSVAFAAWHNGNISTVKTISNYPEDPLVFQKKSLQVPTESGYPVKPILNESVEVDEEVLHDIGMDTTLEEDNDEGDDDEDDEDEDDEDDNDEDDNDDADDPLGIYGTTVDKMDLDAQDDQTDENILYWGYDVVSQSRRANIGGDLDTQVSDIKLITRSKLMASWTIPETS